MTIVVKEPGRNALALAIVAQDNGTDLPGGKTRHFAVSGTLLVTDCESNKPLCSANFLDAHCRDYLVFC